MTRKLVLSVEKFYLPSTKRVGMVKEKSPEGENFLCLMKRKIESKCPILEIHLFPKRKFYLNFEP